MWVSYSSYLTLDILPLQQMYTAIPLPRNNTTTNAPSNTIATRVVVLKEDEASDSLVTAVHAKKHENKLIL